MAFGTCPFESEEEGVKRLAILNGRYTVPQGRRFYMCSFSQNFVDLVARMLQVHAYAVINHLARVCTGALL